MKEKIYYVYEHIRLDDFTCFYVGMGAHGRAFRTKRNKHHDAIAEKFGMAVVIVKDHLTLEQARRLEQKLIDEYVFEYGYGIDIEGFDHALDEPGHLTNATWGGEGTLGLKGSHHPRFGAKLTDAQKEKLRQYAMTRTGARNPNYGNHKLAGENHFNYGKHHSEETKRKIGASNKGKYAGVNNPMYGKRFYGSDNPNFGHKWTDEKREKASEYWKANSAFSQNNPNKRAVVCITTGEVFETVTLAMKKYGITGTSDIGRVCRGINKHCGKLPDGTRLEWRFYEDACQQNEPSTTIESEKTP